MTKALVGLTAGVLLVILAAKVAYNMNTNHGDSPVNEAWARGEMQFVSWNNEKWTAWIHNGEFELAPQNKRTWSRHANVSVAFTNWQGEAWQAKIDGDGFLLAYEGDWRGPVEQTDAIRFRDWSGNNQLRTVAELDR